MIIRLFDIEVGDRIEWVRAGSLHLDGVKLAENLFEHFCWIFFGVNSSKSYLNCH